jgi:hypothetical protein
MFTAANISIGSVSFEPPETASVMAEQVARLGNIIRATSLVHRLVDVPDGTSVYLVAGSFNPNPNVSAWGFMTAVKIRNHVGDAKRISFHLLVVNKSGALSLVYAKTGIIAKH